MSDLLNGLRKALDTIPAPLTWVEEDCEDSTVMKAKRNAGIVEDLWGR